ncbi:transposase-like zinc-binding domain-containing protein, partial [Massilia sp. GCM10023247]|uniref:transposase-like zinc-binding domain-containing protein n=1 Tax=Massilia sp. GCM10023247 TaxID=3252643 RepID=UPI00362408CB
MRARPFKQLLTRIASLTRRQREQLLGLLLPAAKLDKVADLVEQASAARLACPACRSQQLYRHGRANGLQRYRCKECGRT